LVPDRIEEVWADSFAMLMEHKPDNSKSRGQYLDLLAASVREEPNDPRNCFYYARELGFHRKWTEAIEAYKKYLALPKSAWPHEVCYAMLVISRSYEELGNRSEALMWARRATAEAPHTREPWCALAMLAHHSARWAECFGATMSALAITNHEGFYTDDPASWGAQPHDLASIAAWHLGLHSIAVTQAEAAVELAPDDDRMKSNLEFYRRNAMIKDWSQ
jgi:tetratricopeptide (TPR) repeat protein